MACHRCGKYGGIELAKCTSKIYIYIMGKNIIIIIIIVIIIMTIYIYILYLLDTIVNITI